jgi:hypothetical protein
MINIQLMKRRQNRGMLPKLSNCGVHVRFSKVMDLPAHA